MVPVFLVVLVVWMVLMTRWSSGPGVLGCPGGLDGPGDQVVLVLDGMLKLRSSQEDTLFSSTFAATNLFQCTIDLKH